MQNGCWWHCSRKARSHGLPEGFVTFGPAFSDPQLPIEALLLLPSGNCSRGLLQALRGASDLRGCGVGLYLGDPFINIDRVASDFAEWSVSWVTNLPSIAQHDEHFRSDLQEVGFSVDNELEVLAQFRKHGFKTLAAISDTNQARTLADYPADAVLALQTTDELQISFPSASKRQAMARSVTETLPDSMIGKPVITLTNEGEATFTDSITMMRPEVFSLIESWPANGNGNQESRS